MTNQFQAKTFDDFIEKDHLSQLLNYSRTTNQWREIPNNFWDRRTINYNVVKNTIHRFGDILEHTAKKIQKTLVKEYNLTETPYADTMDLVRWFVGMQQTPHCDDMSDNQKEHKNFAHRYFGCVLYLNDDYDGGLTYYPDHNFSIKPKAGTLAVHLGDQNHRHGVTKVEKNIRYTIASFWTFDKNLKLSGIDW